MSYQTDALRAMMPYILARLVEHTSPNKIEQAAVLNGLLVDLVAGFGTADDLKGQTRISQSTMETQAIIDKARAILGVAID